MKKKKVESKKYHVKIFMNEVETETNLMEKKNLNLQTQESVVLEDEIETINCN